MKANPKNNTSSCNSIRRIDFTGAPFRIPIAFRRFRVYVLVSCLALSFALLSLQGCYGLQDENVLPVCLLGRITPTGPLEVEFEGYVDNDISLVDFVGFVWQKRPVEGGLCVPIFENCEGENQYVIADVSTVEQYSASKWTYTIAATMGLENNAEYKIRAFCVVNDSVITSTNTTFFSVKSHQLSIDSAFVDTNSNNISITTIVSVLDTAFLPPITEHGVIYRKDNTIKPKDITLRNSNPPISSEGPLPKKERVFTSIFPDPDTTLRNKYFKSFVITEHNMELDTSYSEAVKVERN